MHNNLADEQYWNGVWDFNTHHSPAERPEIFSSAITDWLERVFAAHLSARDSRFVEVGAGGSAWPARVASKWKADAWGIDFSSNGLELASRAAIPNSGSVRLIQGDLFDRDALPAHSFHVVYSGGFVEHFPESEAVMERFVELLAPNGVVITTVPNLCGVNGFLQKWVDNDTFQRHVVLSPEALDAAHATAGLIPIEPAHFVGLVDLTAVNFSTLAARMPKLAFRSLSYALTKIRIAGDWYGKHLQRRGGRWFAPLVG